MKSLALALSVLALVAVAFAGSCTTSNSCQTTYDTCQTYATTKVPTCECTIAYRTCMNNGNCCPSSNSTACDTQCTSNCKSTTCVWPPTLSDTCANRAVCMGTYNCQASDCKCQVERRQCLLFQGCSFDSTLSGTCTTACSSRTPTPDCSAKAASAVPTPTAPVACTPNTGYLNAGDCSCRDELRDVAASATCSNATWTISGNLQVGASQVLSLQFDRVEVGGDLTVANGGQLSFTLDAASSVSALVVVDGTTTINGNVGIFIQSTDTTPQQFSLVTSTTLTAPSASALTYPTAPVGYCFTDRQYQTASNMITFTYTLQAGATSCAPTPGSAPEPSPTTGVANRPSPVKYTPPPQSDSAAFLAPAFAFAALAMELMRLF